MALDHLLGPQMKFFVFLFILSFSFTKAMSAGDSHSRRADSIHPFSESLISLTTHTAKALDDTEGLPEGKRQEYEISQRDTWYKAHDQKQDRAVDETLEWLRVKLLAKRSLTRDSLDELLIEAQAKLHPWFGPDEEMEHSPVYTENPYINADSVAEVLEIHRELRRRDKIHLSQAMYAIRQQDKWLDFQERLLGIADEAAKAFSRRRDRRTRINMINIAFGKTTTPRAARISRLRLPPLAAREAAESHTAGAAPEGEAAAAPHHESKANLLPPVRRRGRLPAASSSTSLSASSGGRLLEGEESKREDFPSSLPREPLPRAGLPPVSRAH